MTSNQWKEWISRWGKNITLIVTLVTGVASLAGFAWKFSQFVDSQLERDRAAKITQLTTYSNFGDMLRKYREVVKKTDRFLSQYRQHPLDQAALDALLSKYKTGSSIYSSEELANFSEIRGFYEELGTLIRFGAIDFDLAFEVITFPTDFFEETQPVANFVGLNWFGKDRSLPDFMFNASQLAKNYDNKRKHLPVKFDNP
ncbi:MAG: hypothetical protein MUO63_04435 [Desulfobulbaceae bacterium]|nr:hypothetical protein [Desulfobulbaceae bacterium]